MNELSTSKMLLVRRSSARIMKSKRRAKSFKRKSTRSRRRWTKFQKKRLSSIRAVCRIEVDQQLQKWEDAVKDNSKKVSYWKREIKKLDLQEVPGEEVTPLPELTEEEILSINMEELNYEITAIDENLAKSKPNMAAIAEYKKKEEVNNNSGKLVANLSN